VGQGEGLYTLPKAILPNPKPEKYQSGNSLVSFRYLVPLGDSGGAYYHVLTRAAPKHRTRNCACYRGIAKTVARVLAEHENLQLM
jgi:hypothetical protein